MGRGNSLSTKIHYRVYKIEEDGSRTFVNEYRTNEEIATKLGVSQAYMYRIINKTIDHPITKIYDIEKLPFKRPQATPKRRYFKADRKIPIENDPLKIEQFESRAA